MKLNSTQLNNQVEEKNASEIRKYFDMNENKSQHIDMYEVQENSAQRDIYSYEFIYCKERKIPN